MYYKEAKQLALYLKRHMRFDVPQKYDIEIVGSVAREEDKIKDIDFLIITDRKVPNILKKVYFDTDKITIDHISDCGDRKCFVYLNNLKIDLFYAVRKDEAFALLHHIGPKSYLLRIRRLAKSKGYLLNQYGIFHRDSGRRVSGKFDTVCDIQKFINISCRPPQKRR